MLDVLQPAGFYDGKLVKSSLALELIEQQKNEAFQTALALLKHHMDSQHLKKIRRLFQ